MSNPNAKLLAACLSFGLLLLLVYLFGSFRAQSIGFERTPTPSFEFVGTPQGPKIQDLAPDRARTEKAEILILDDNDSVLQFYVPIELVPTFLAEHDTNVKQIKVSPPAQDLDDVEQELVDKKADLQVINLAKGIKRTNQATIIVEKKDGNYEKWLVSNDSLLETLRGIDSDDVLVGFWLSRAVSGRRPPDVSTLGTAVPSGRSTENPKSEPATTVP